MKLPSVTVRLLISHAECLAPFTPGEQIVKDHSRNENRGKQVGYQADGQRDREPLDGACSEGEKYRRGGHGSDVGIDDSLESVFEPSRHGGTHCLAGTQFLPDAFKHQHIRIDAHTDSEDHSRNAGKREYGSKIAQCRHENQQVEEERHVIAVRIGDAFRAVWALVLREPMYTQALVVAAIGLGTSFGLGWTAQQVGSVSAVSAAVLAFLTRQAVTPIAAPTLPAGTAVTVQTPAGQPDRTVVLPR